MAPQPSGYAPLTRPTHRLSFGANRPLESAEPETLDCLLIHHARDKAAARELAAALRKRGISVWLDEDCLRPGVSWQSSIESAISSSRSVVVLVGADGRDPWESEEMHAALSLAVSAEVPVVPVLLIDAPAEPALPLFLHGRAWVDLRAADSDTLSPLERLIWGITGRHPDCNRDLYQPARRGSAEGDDLLHAIKAFINQPDFLPNDTRLEEVNSKEVVFLDGNGYRVHARRSAYRSYLDSLYQYVLAKRDGATESALSAKRREIEGRHHPTVWREMIRIRDRDPELGPLFAEAPELI
jgi:hypothetical protein